MRRELTVYSAGYQLPQAPVAPEAQRVRRVAQADDVAWFLGHPRAQARLRAYQVGEFGAAHDDAWIGVLVRKLGPGLRVREPVARAPLSAQATQPITVTLDDDGQTVLRQEGARVVMLSPTAPGK